MTPNKKRKSTVSPKQALLHESSGITKLAHKQQEAKNTTTDGIKRQRSGDTN
jgi:hypothetical protein